MILGSDKWQNDMTSKEGFSEEVTFRVETIQEKVRELNFPGREQKVQKLKDRKGAWNIGIF